MGEAFARIRQGLTEAIGHAKRAHPLYDDEELVAKTTRQLLHKGHSVFQLWHLASEEREHALRVLEVVDPMPGAHVLSLGCGVAGMEGYWHRQRPDLRFTLVNTSPAQLDLCQCPGERMCEDAHHFTTPERPVDLTVLAYVLGHVDAEAVLTRAINATRGTVLVLDVFDTPPAFESLMVYQASQEHLMCALGFEQVLEYPSGGMLEWRLSSLIREAPVVRDVVAQSQPAMWVRKCQS